jgi:hypothetical protein
MLIRLLQALEWHAQHRRRGASECLHFELNGAYGGPRLFYLKSSKQAIIYAILVTELNELDANSKAGTKFYEMIIVRIHFESSFHIIPRCGLLPQLNSQPGHPR